MNFEEYLKFTSAIYSWWSWIDNNWSRTNDCIGWQTANRQLSSYRASWWWIKSESHIKNFKSSCSLTIVINSWSIGVSFLEQCCFLASGLVTSNEVCQQQVQETGKTLKTQQMMEILYKMITEWSSWSIIKGLWSVDFLSFCSFSNWASRNSMWASSAVSTKCCCEELVCQPGWFLGILILGYAFVPSPERNRLDA